MKVKALEWKDRSDGEFSMAKSPFTPFDSDMYTIWKENTENDQKFYLIGGVGQAWSERFFKTEDGFPPGVETMEEAKAQAEALNQHRAEIFLKTYYEEV